MLITKRLFTHVASVACALGVAILALLAIPPLSGANPGTGPQLVQRTGQFVILHADSRDHGSTRQWMLRNGLNYTPVRAPAGVWIEPGARVRLEGTMQDGALVLGDTISAVRQLSRSPNTRSATSAAPPIQTTAVVMFYFPGESPSDLPPTSSVAATMNTDTTSLKAYYLEQTYNQVTFNADVFTPVQLSQSSDPHCDNFEDWAAEAESLNPGLDPSQYKHIVYVFPDQTACGWAGLADVGGPHVWINGSFLVAVLAHELGHNLGLYHAGGLTCTSSGAPAPMGDSCSIDRLHYQLPQYADPFDAMGNASVLRQMSMEHKLTLGLLPATAVQTVGVSGNYHLAPMETLTGSVELLRLPKAGGGSYFVEYRRAVGVFDSQAPALSPGVLIRTESPDIVSYFSDSDTALIDMHPDGSFSSNQWRDAAMSVGQVFNDALRGITVQTTSQDANGATLAITMPIDTQPPSRPPRLSAVISGASVALQWSPATDDYAVASYVVTRDGAQVGAMPATTMTFGDSIAPGVTATYGVSAVDTAGNVGPAATVAVTSPDILAPGAPQNVTAKVSRDGQVHIAWGAATDNVGVTSYRVLRNGTGIVQANVGAFVDKAPQPGSGASVTYSVVAFDVVGNAGPPALAKPLRAALLRKLRATHLKVSRLKQARHSPVRIQGIVSDARAVCRLRVAGSPWRSCKTRPNGSFSTTLPVRGAKIITLSLRDELGRVKRQALRVP
ncbi:MAG TPA: hypothetical protein VFD90_10515 [Gaiellales bacterium]|jgi:hypothetical protein|nr:hypothetical protein [Gaiellales bacterium]